MALNKKIILDIYADEKAINNDYYLKVFSKTTAVSRAEHSVYKRKFKPGIFT